MTPSRTADSVRDQRIERVEPLASPHRLLDELPLSEEHVGVVLRGRSQVHAILDGDDDRLLVVVGPCSVHDLEATLEYADRLSAVAERLKDELLIAMRVYFEKPRTTTGWKGLISDPHLDGSGDVNEGLRRARHVLLGVLSAGLPVGCEFLDPITPQYISDVGFKNRTDGNVQVAVDAVRAAAVPHAFAGIDHDGTPAIHYTRGNHDCHIILRGGRGGPNYGAEAFEHAISLLRAAGLPERAMIDFSHDNSGKDPFRQPSIARDVGGQIAAGNEGIIGVMIESFLAGGRQELGPDELVYGQSITDACLDWESTAALLDGLAASVRARRDR